MRILSIKLKNIRSYLDEHIVFPSGSILLSGDIGSGKTTVLLAIDFALFGTRRSELNSTELLRNGTNEGFVELKIELNGKEITIRRNLKRKKSISQESGTIEIESATEYMPTEMNAKINELIGYPEKNNSSIYRFSVYTPQEEMKLILQDKEKRIQILRKIFDIDKYGLIKENAKTLLSDLRSEKRIYDEQSKDILERNDELRLEENKIIYLDIQLKEKEMFIKEIYNKINEINENIIAAKKLIQKSNELKIEITKKQTEFSQKKLILKKIEGDLVNSKVKIADLEKRNSIYKESKKPDQPIDITNIEKTREFLIKNISILSKEVENLKDTLTKGICSHCGQSVHNALSFELNMRTKEDEIKRKSLELNKITEDLTLSKKINEDNMRYKIIEEKQNSIKKELDGEKQREKENSEERENIITELEEIEKYISKLNLNLDESMQNNYDNLEKEMKKLNNKNLELEKDYSSTNQQMNDKKENIEIIKREIQKKKEMKDKSIKITAYVNWIEDTFINLISNIEKHVMILIQKEFDSIFREYFSLFISDINVRIDEDFTPVIEQNSYETLYENLSGGEKTSIALSYRLALNKIINSLIETIRTKDLLILDEPTDGFSSEQLDKLRDVISILNVKQLIIVSHEQKIDTFVDNVIRIEKDNHISKLQR